MFKFTRGRIRPGPLPEGELPSGARPFGPLFGGVVGGSFHVWFPFILDEVFGFSNEPTTIATIAAKYEMMFTKLSPT